MDKNSIDVKRQNTVWCLNPLSTVKAALTLPVACHFFAELFILHCIMFTANIIWYVIVTISSSSSIRTCNVVFAGVKQSDGVRTHEACLQSTIHSTSKLVHRR